MEEMQMSKKQQPSVSAETSSSTGKYSASHGVPVQGALAVAAAAANLKAGPDLRHPGRMLAIKEPDMITDTKTLGELVRRARKNIKFTQEKVAVYSGVGRRFVSELERGKPSLEFGKVLMVLKTVGVDLSAKIR